MVHVNGLRLGRRVLCQRDVTGLCEQNRLLRDHGHFMDGAVDDEVASKISSLFLRVVNHGFQVKLICRSPDFKDPY